MLRTAVIIFVSAFILFSCGDNDDLKSQSQTRIAIQELPDNYRDSEEIREKLKSGTLTVQEKKQRFKNIMVPAIENVRADLQNQYERISAAMKNGTDRNFDELKEEYRAKTDEQLLQALKPHPTSIVLAQAAMESAWATSRFYRIANNVFGVWSFDEGEPRIAAGVKRGNKTIYVKRYDSVEESVRDYYRVLARGSAFKEFRELRVETENPFELVKKLDSYSEKGELYGEELASIIRYNNFTEFDR